MYDFDVKQKSWTKSLIIMSPCCLTMNINIRCVCVHRLYERLCISYTNKLSNMIFAYRKKNKIISSAGTGFWRPLQTVWIQMRRHRTWRLIRIQTVCYSDSILWKKIKENANFRNLADNILADDKFPSMQRVNLDEYTCYLRNDAEVPFTEYVI